MDVQLVMVFVRMSDGPLRNVPWSDGMTPFLDGVCA